MKEHIALVGLGGFEAAFPYQLSGGMAQRAAHDVDEAVYLGIRVVVLQPRPGRIRRTVEVDVPHPRARPDPRLKTLSEHVRGAIIDVPKQ